MSNSALQLSTFFLAMVVLLLPGPHMAGVGLRMLVRELRERNPAERQEGVATLLAGLLVTWVTFYIGIPCLFFCWFGW